LLPFLQAKKIASVIIAKRNKDGSSDAPDVPEDEHHPELMSASEDMIKAVHAKDTDGVAAAFKRAHEHLSSEQQSDNEIED
jgi:hypothetical protein